MKQKSAQLLFILVFIKELFCQNHQQYFRVRPIDREVVVGEDVEFRCHVGNREGNVQWSKDGFLLGFDAKIPGFPRYFMEVDEEKGIYNLRLLNVGVQDEGEYQCQVGPAFNHTPIRAAAHLKILIAPTYISINDSDESGAAVIEVKQNTPVRLKCETLGSRPAARIKWYVNNTEVSPESVHTEAKEQRGKFVTTSYFSIRPKIEDNNSRIGCEAFHKALDRKLKSQVILSVLHPPAIPKILGYIEGTVVKAGDALSLLCMTEGGNPLPELIWYRGNAQIDASYYSLPGRKTANNLTLTITSTDNGGAYHCQATNAATRDPQTATIKLSVYHHASKLKISGPEEAARGETITLSCVTDVSNPKSLISWSVDGEAVEGSDSEEVVATKSSSGWITNSNLTITLTRQEPDVKMFKCSAKNPNVDGDVSATHKLRVSYPPNMPTILGHDPSASLRAGDIQRFNCVALGGNPPATLKWFKGDREISAPMRTTGSGVSSELLIRVQLNDNGATYKCEAHNAALKKPMSAYVRLAVQFPAAFVNISYYPLEPRSGENVTLTCTSGSSNPLSRITWKKDSSFLRDHREETLSSAYGGIATRSRLSFIADAGDDRSLFTCQARSDVFKSPVSQTITLRIRHKPMFASVHQVVDVEEKQPLVLNLTTDAYPEKVAYIWFHNGQKIPSGSSRLSASGPMFYLRNASRDDNGMYYCTAENDEGTSNASVVLNILYGVSIVNLSRTDSEGPLLEEGKSASFQCEVDGNPVKSDMIEWRLKGSTMREGQPMEGGRRSILKISNVSRDHRGALECVGNNGIGEPSLTALLLNVLYKPVVIRSVALTVGNLGRLSCTVDGPGDMTVTWRFNGSVIHPLSTNKYQVTFTKRGDNEWISMLTVSNISNFDYGAYICTATNSLGQNQAEIILGDKFHEVVEITTTSAGTVRDFGWRFYNPRFWWIPAAAIGIFIVLLSCVIILCCMRKKSNRTAHEDCRRARHIDLGDLTADEVCNKLLLSTDIKSLLLCAAEKQRIPMQDFKEHSVFTIEDAFNIDIMSGRSLSSNKEQESKLNGEDGVRETLLAEIPPSLEKPKDDRPDILRNEKSGSLSTIKEVPDSCSTPASGSPESPRFASTPSGSTGSCLSVYHEKVPLRSLDVENPDLMKLHPVMVLGRVDDSFTFKDS